MKVFVRSSYDDAYPLHARPVGVGQPPLGTITQKGQAGIHIHTTGSRAIAIERTSNFSGSTLRAFYLIEETKAERKITLFSHP